MKAGTAKINITPPVGMELSGYIGRVQPSIGIHDELFCRALFLEHETEKLLWLHCDLLGFDSALADEIRAAVAKLVGLAERQVALSAIHTHSGPAVSFLRNCGKPDAAYVETLKSWLLEAARTAAAEPEPVMPGWAEGTAEIALDRRNSPDFSHVDRRLAAVVLRRPDGGLKAVIANFPVHNVALTQENRLISADLFGVAASLAETGLPDQPVVLLTNGACGNLNPVRRSNTFEAAAELGEILGKRLIEVVDKAKPCAATLDSAETRLALPLDVPDQDWIDAEWRRVTASFRNSNDYFPARYRAAMDEWRDTALAALKSADPPKSVETVVQVIRLGPAHFALLGAEVFSRMAEDLRAAAGSPFYVVGYANGVFGYLPPAPDYALGSYEVTAAYKFYGLFMVAPGAFELLRDKALELARSLGAAPRHNCP